MRTGLGALAIALAVGGSASGAAAEPDDDDSTEDGGEIRDDSIRLDDDGTGWGSPDADAPLRRDPDPVSRGAIEIDLRRPPRPPDPLWPEGRSWLAVITGAGAPTGIAGLEVGRDVTRSLGLSLGLGAGLAGPQVAVVVRGVAVRPRDGLALSIGGGVSFGDADDRAESRIGGDYVARLDGAMWLNLDAALELRTEDGWFGRGAVGVGVVATTLDCTYGREAAGGLSTGNPASSVPCTERQEHLLWPALSLAVGRGF